MTRYTVTWWPEAEAELANLWLSSADRKAISDASNQIDRLLAIDPDTVGEAAGDRLRILEIPPLRILFGYHELDRRVSVLSVRLIVSPSG
jgi:hypothetical protein